MAKQSDLTKRIEKLRSFWFEQAETLTNQYMLDITLITLHRLFGFSSKRLGRFMAELAKIHDRYYPVFKVTKDNPECDKLRAELDTLLKECCGKDDIVPFGERYPTIKEVKYGR